MPCTSGRRLNSTRTCTLLNEGTQAGPAGAVHLTAVEALQRLQVDLRERTIELHLAEARGPVTDRLKGTELPRRLAHEPFLSVHEAGV